MMKFHRATIMTKSLTCHFLHPLTPLTGLCLVAFLTGCLGVPTPQGSPTLREAMRLEAAATSQRSLVAPGQSLEDLGRALRLFSLMDDIPGMVRVHLSIARLFEQHNQPREATHHAEQALQLEHNGLDPVYLYRTYLMVGRLKADKEMFEKALAFTHQPLQKAVALTYLGRHTEAFAMSGRQQETNVTQVADLAFVLHGYARSKLDADAASRALEMYKRADDYQGIADSLRLLAYIATEQKNQAAAKDYGVRAMRVESAMRDRQPALTTGKPEASQ